MAGLEVVSLGESTPQGHGGLHSFPSPSRHTYGQPISEVVQTVSQEDHPRYIGATATLVPVTVALVPSRGWDWWGLAVLLPVVALSFWLCRKDKDSASGCK